MWDLEKHGNNIFDIEDKNTDFDYKKFIVSNKEIDDDVKLYLEGKFKRGLGVGVGILDDYWLLKENQLTASTGKKGGGKTTISQIMYLMWAIVHPHIRYVVCFQENDDWHAKFNLISMLLGKCLYDIQEMHKAKDPLFEKALAWLNERYYFIDVPDVKTALMVTSALKKDGVDIHTVHLDPINSFKSGYSNTGNKGTDLEETALQCLLFTKTECSIHVSQHPTMLKQRDPMDTTSYDAEYGKFLNKAHITYAINRDKGTNENRIAVDNERTTHMGGGQTYPEAPIILHWSPSAVDLELTGGERVDDVFQILRERHNPLNEGVSAHFKKLDTFEDEPEKLAYVSPADAFGTEEDGLPF